MRRPTRPLDRHARIRSRSFGYRINRLSQAGHVVTCDELHEHYQGVGNDRRPSPILDFDRGSNFEDRLGSLDPVSPYQYETPPDPFADSHSGREPQVSEAIIQDAGFGWQNDTLRQKDRHQGKQKEAVSHCPAERPLKFRPLRIKMHELKVARCTGKEIHLLPRHGSPSARTKIDISSLGTNNIGPRKRHRPTAELPTRRKAIVALSPPNANELESAA